MKILHLLYIHSNWLRFDKSAAIRLSLAAGTTRLFMGFAYREYGGPLVLLQGYGRCVIAIYTAPSSRNYAYVALIQRMCLRIFNAGAFLTIKHQFRYVLLRAYKF